MNSRAFLRFSAWLALASALLVSGCASGPKVDWSKRIGLYSYDEAVREYGPPDKKESTSDGATVAEWVVERGMIYGTPSPGWGMGWRRYGGYGWNGAQEIHSTPDTVLRMQFGPDAKLQSWKQYAK